MAVPADLSRRVDDVRARVGSAVSAADRDPDDITTIVVTKFHPAELVRDLHTLGFRDFGENRHQQAQGKSAETSDLEGVRWHFIGQLQSKKARQVRAYAHAVHSLDRDSVVDALGAPGAAPGDGAALLEVFVQINLTDDPGRGGAAPHELEPLVERVLATGGLRLRGVMAVAPLDEHPRAAFARLRGYSERVRGLAPEATAISAGMSHDFAEALLEGATHLRIGTAITGNRPDPR